MIFQATYFKEGGEHHYFKKPAENWKRAYETQQFVMLGIRSISKLKSRFLIQDA